MNLPMSRSRRSSGPQQQRLNRSCSQSPKPVDVAGGGAGEEDVLSHPSLNQMTNRTRQKKMKVRIQIWCQAKRQKNLTRTRKQQNYRNNWTDSLAKEKTQNQMTRCQLRHSHKPCLLKQGRRCRLLQMGRQQQVQPNRLARLGNNWELISPGWRRESNWVWWLFLPSSSWQDRQKLPVDEGRLCKKKKAKLACLRRVVQYQNCFACFKNHLPLFSGLDWWFGD